MATVSNTLIQNTLPMPVRPNSGKSESSCSKCCKQVKDTVTYAANTMLEVETVSKTTKLGAAVIGLKDAIEPASAGWKNLYVALKGCIAWLDVLEVIKRIKEWVSGEVKGIWKTLNRICLTAVQTIGVMKFLDKVKLINLSQIPVLGVIVALPAALLGLAAYVFSSIHNGVKVAKACTDARKSAAKLELLDIKKRVLSLLTESDDKINRDLPGLEKAYIETKREVEVAKAKKDGVPLRQKWFDFLDKANSGNIGNCEDAVKNAIQRHSIKEHNAKLDKSKSLVALIADISKALFSALGIIGFFVGGVLAMTSIPMLALATAAAAIGVFKVFFDKRKPKEDPSTTTNTQAQLKATQAAALLNKDIQPTAPASAVQNSTQDVKGLDSASQKVPPVTLSVI